MTYQPPAVESMQRIDTPIVLGVFSGPPATWTTVDEPGDEQD